MKEGLEYLRAEWIEAKKHLAERDAALVRVNDQVIELQARLAKAGMEHRHDEVGPSEFASWLTPHVKSVGEGSGAGSYLVPEQYAPYVWDRLAASSVGLTTGFSVIQTVRDKLHLPRVTSDPTSDVVGEAGAITPSDPGVDEVIATPYKFAAMTVFSNEARDDSTPAVVDVISRGLLRSVALKADLHMFEGSGSGQIHGLKNVSGIGTVSLGTNGAQLTNLDPFADALAALEGANASATAIICHPRTWATLRKIKEATGSVKPLMQNHDGSGADAVRRSIYGVPVYLSSQLSTTEVQGTSSDCSSAYVVQADQIVVVQRSDARVEIDPYGLFANDQSRIRVILRLDMVVPNPSSVVRVLGIRP